MKKISHSFLKKVIAGAIALGLGISAGSQIAGSTLYYNDPSTKIEQSMQEEIANDKYSTNQEVASYISKLSEDQSKFISNAFYYTFHEYSNTNKLGFSSTDITVKDGKLYVFDYKSTKTYKDAFEENKARSYVHNMYITNVKEYNLTKEQEVFVQSFIECERYFHFYEEGNEKSLNKFKSSLATFISTMTTNKNSFIKAMSDIFLGTSDLDDLFINLSEIISPYFTSILKNEKSYDCNNFNSITHDLKDNSNIERKEEIYTLQDLTSFFDQTIDEFKERYNTKTK